MNTNLDKPGKQEHGGFEHEDLGVSGVVYGLGGLAVFCLIVHFLVTGLYHALDNYANSTVGAPMSPLITDVPNDVRHVEKGYPQGKFPNPKLEEDEVGQFKSILTAQEETLNSYGWIDQKAGVARIPIDRAMDLVVQRGLPVYGQQGGNAGPVAGKEVKK